MSLHPAPVPATNPWANAAKALSAGKEKQITTNQVIQANEAPKSVDLSNTDSHEAQKSTISTNGKSRGKARNKNGRNSNNNKNGNNYNYNYNYSYNHDHDNDDGTSTGVKLKIKERKKNRPIDNNNIAFATQNSENEIVVSETCKGDKPSSKEYAEGLDSTSKELGDIMQDTRSCFERLQLDNNTQRRNDSGNKYNGINNDSNNNSNHHLSDGSYRKPRGRFTPITNGHQNGYIGRQMYYNQPPSPQSPIAATYGAPYAPMPYSYLYPHPHPHQHQHPYPYSHPHAHSQPPAPAPPYPYTHPYQHPQTLPPSPHAHDHGDSINCNEENKPGTANAGVRRVSMPVYGEPVYSFGYSYPFPYPPQVYEQAQAQAQAHAHAQRYGQGFLVGNASTVPPVYMNSPTSASVSVTVSAPVKTSTTTSEPNSEYNMPLGYGQVQSEEELVRQTPKYASLHKQIKFYFSVDNLCRDMYLRKQMDADGFISEDVIKNFNRVKTLSDGDDELVEKVIADIAELEWCVEEDGSKGGKVRLRNGWENWVLRK